MAHPSTSDEPTAPSQNTSENSSNTATNTANTPPAPAPTTKNGLTLHNDSAWSLFDTQDGITWHVISADDAAGQRVYGVRNTFWLAGKFFAVVALNPGFNDDGTPRA